MKLIDQRVIVVNIGNGLMSSDIYANPDDDGKLWATRRMSDIHSSTEVKDFMEKVISQFFLRSSKIVLPSLKWSQKSTQKFTQEFVLNDYTFGYNY